VVTAKPRGRGRVALERHLPALGIRLIHSRAYHPQTCGKVERFHQTLKRWLTAQDPADTTDQLQAQLDAFVAWFRGRDGHCWPPPAQIPACAFNALGS
jgi:transposase InsO family protein